jgi:bacterioferritin-associated ferredoxin
VYVCLCHGLSERDIRAAVACGARTLEEVSALTGCGTCCGCCREMAAALVADAAATAMAEPRLARAA